jgi:protein TonB
MDFSATGLRAAVDGPYDWGSAMSDRQERLRLTAALATSAAFHLVALVVLLHSARVAELLSDVFDTPRVKLIPVSLVSLAGGGGGGPLPGSPSPALSRAGNPSSSSEPLVAPKASPPPPPLPAAQAKPTAVATPNATALASLRALAAPVPARAQPSAAPTQRQATAPPAATGAASAGGASDRVASLGGQGATGDGRGGPGSGDGSGGDGSDAMARPAYGSNPKPPYPLAARRLGVEGVVTLEVLVRPDGSPAEVRVQSSSGSPLLDASALDTVRKSWRFIPARRGNVPIESRVTFPVRFRLSEG